MRPRATPGTQVSAGRLRVDAARAISKLREYRLADRTAWVLEAIRAAVASGAAHVELQGDSNDVWLRWDGEPLPAEDLPRLFDELVSPQAAGERQHVRLLAAAVNSALGLAPAYVDVFSVEGNGRAVRARYTPEVLVPPDAELGEAPLHRLVAEPCPPPPHTGRGMAVHLRRRFGLEVLTYLLRSEPPALALARAACQELAVRLRVGRDELGRHRQERDVVRLPLGEELDGFLALVDPGDAGEPGDPGASSAPGAREAMEIAERGVVLQRGVLELGLSELPGSRPLPVRLFIDAPQMPTNASRSQVRPDAHPIPAAARRAVELFPKAVDELVAQLGPERDPTTPAFRRARRTALALLGAIGDRWSWGLPPQLRALGELPLVRDATGAPQRVARLWRPFVHDGLLPLPIELATWLSDVLWIPAGDASEQLLPASAYDASAARDHVRWARAEHRANRRFFAHARGEPRVAPQLTPRIRAPLHAHVAASDVPDAWFEGMRGEVCILPSGNGGELTLFLDGRELERLTHPGAIPFAVAIEAAFLPADRYRAVARDATFARAQSAMLGAVLRAMEALALAEAGEPVPRELVLGPSADPEPHARSLRAALSLAAEVLGNLEGPLLWARAWRGTDGSWISLGDLRALPGSAFGTVSPAQAPVISLPAGRFVIEAEAHEHRQLMRLAPGVRIVRYDAARSRASLSATALGAQLLRSGHPFALAITRARYAAAIAPALASRLTVHHHGVALAEHAYSGLLGAFAISIDADAAVPDEAWGRAVEAGFDLGETQDWEVALLRAIARALCGQRPAELLGKAGFDPEHEVHEELGEVLALALSRREPAALLGDALHQELRERPLFYLLGSDRPWSAAALVEKFPHELPYLDDADTAGAGLDPAVWDGFTPLLAGPAIARMAGQLGGPRHVVDATDELKRRHAQAVRAKRLAAHRARPALPPVFPEGVPHVELSPRRGSVGVAGDGVMALHVYVEQRLLQVVRSQVRLPLLALVEVDPELVDEAFEALPSWELQDLLDDVEARLVPLLVAIAQGHPELLADPGPSRALLARALKEDRIVEMAVDRLGELVTFPTLQGPRLTLASAPRQLTCASWQGDWLERTPDDGPLQITPEPPILFVPAEDQELRELLKAMHRGWVNDVTESVVKLQGRRRLEQGLVPRPSVPGALPALKRKLEELGELGKVMAPGEIALVDAPHSSLLVHAHGVLRERVPLRDVLPVVQLAMEDPAGRAIPTRPLSELLAGLSQFVEEEQQELAMNAQRLALELVQQVVAVTGGRGLPPWALRGLRLAILTRRMISQLMEVPAFQLATRERIAWREVVAQIETFGDVWTVPMASLEEPPQPLDPRRLVLLLAPEEQKLARQHGRPFLDATHELGLDYQARVNAARAPVAALRFPPQVSLLGETELGGDGVAAPRGRVGVLAPGHAEHRGLAPHRAMQRFELLADECPWPTLAVIDDARFTPDRTWANVVADEVLAEVREAVRAASEQVLTSLVRIPDDALASTRITAETCASLISLRGTKGQLRGALWIARPQELAAGSPRATFVSVVEGDRHRLRPMPDGLELLGFSGMVLGFVPAADRSRLTVTDPAAESAAGDASPLRDEVLAELCNNAHVALTGELMRRDDVDPELIAAHVAAVLLRGDVLPPQPDARPVFFSCFRPEPLDLDGLAALLRSRQQVPLVDAEATVSALSICEDGSALARVLVPRLAADPSRDRAGSWGARPTPPPPAASAFATTAAAPAPAKPLPAAKPRPVHPLDPMIALVRQRLAATGIPLPGFAIVDGSVAPSVRYADAILYFAGDAPQLRAIAAACLAGTAWHTAAIDALVAHLVSVLNLALTSVTDATEQHALGLLLASI